MILLLDHYLVQQFSIIRLYYDSISIIFEALLNKDQTHHLSLTRRESHQFVLPSKFDLSSLQFQDF